MSSLLQLLIACFSIWCVVADPPEFDEGDANSTVNIVAVVAGTKTFRCTVKTPALATDQIESLNLEPTPGEGANWEIKTNTSADSNWWIEVTIHDVGKANEDLKFECIAINIANDTTTLTYHLTTVYDGTTFEEGDTNTTISRELTVGIVSEIRCTIKNADPMITSLSIEPEPPLGNTDYMVIGDGVKWIGMKFIDIDDDVPTEFVCKAISDVTTAELTYSMAYFDGIKFNEGDTNGTVNTTIVAETTGSIIKCSIASADPEIMEDLQIEPVPLPGNEDYKIVSNGTTSIEVEFLRISDSIPSSFLCTAKNNMTIATLTYSVTVADPVAPVFDLGGNDTNWSEMPTGSNITLYCNVSTGVSVPPVTLISGEPVSAPGDNWEIKTNGLSSIEFIITEADGIKNKRDYICIASNGVRTTVFTYQNYAGGPPTAVDVTLDSVIDGKQIEFSISVTDKSTAPAQHIIFYIEGITDGNITLNVSRPDNYDDEIKYSFSKFHKTSLDSVRQNATVKIFASNVLGDVHVKDFSIAIPAVKGKSNSGKIAAGILVPFFLVLGAVIIGVVVFYFWRKHRKGSLGFSPVGGGGDDIDDASKSTYGTL